MQAADQMQEQPDQQQQQQQQQRPRQQHNVLPPAFLSDPGAFLLNVASRAPTPDGLGKLAGPVAKWFVSAAAQSSNPAEFHAAAQIAPLYLQAAAVQLRGFEGSAGYTDQNRSLLQQDVQQTKNQYQVLDAVGCVAASLCQDRAAIFQILPTLSRLMIQSQNTAAAVINETESGGGGGGGGGGGREKSRNRDRGRGGGQQQQGGFGGIGAVAAAMFGHSSAGTLDEAVAAATTGPDDAPNNNNTNPLGLTTLSRFPPLQQVSVEFLQCALAAEHYRYAARMIEGTWPRPTSTVNVKTVLRYYYLRGMIHLGCQDYLQAHRCWWACLSVPSASDSNDANSAIAVAAWKKMVLVQPLINHRCNRTMTTTGGSKSTSSHHPSSQPLPNSVSKNLTKTLTTDGTCTVYSQISQAADGGAVKTIQSLLSPSSGGDAENTSMTDAEGGISGDRLSAGASNSAYPVLMADGNYGLAQECLKQARCNQVWQASKLFSAVPIEKLARRWDVPIEYVPGRLMEASSDDGPRGMTRNVRFRLEQPEAVAAGGVGGQDLGSTIAIFEQDEDDDTSNGTAQFVSPTASFADLGDWMYLLERVQQLDVSFVTNRKYHSISKRDGKGGPRGGGSGAASAGIGSDGAGDVGMRDADNVTSF